jgi:phage shock protein A
MISPTLKERLLRANTALGADTNGLCLEAREAIEELESQSEHGQALEPLVDELIKAADKRIAELKLQVHEREAKLERIERLSNTRASVTNIELRAALWTIDREDDDGS